MTRWAAGLASLAALSGAAGVVAAAGAAHGVAGADLKTAADFLMLHAAAVIAVSAWAASASRGGLCVVAGGLLLSGNLLFCADLAKHARYGSSLFPMAAPLGGTIVIFGWIAVAFALLATAVKKPG